MKKIKKKKGHLFWVNAGAFTAGVAMMVTGLVAAYAQHTEVVAQLPTDTDSAASSSLPLAAASASSGPVIIERPQGMAASSASKPASAPAYVRPVTPANGRSTFAKGSISTVKRPAPNPPPVSLPKVTLYPGEVRVLRQPDVARIAIGNGSLLKATIVDEKQVVLLAEGAGETEVHFWFRNGREVQFDVVVQPQRVSSALEEVQKLLAHYPTVKAKASGPYIVLEGSYPNVDAADKIKKLASLRTGVINLIPDAPVETNTVHPEPMIYLDLRVVEVRKTALDQLGIRWASTAEGPTFAMATTAYSNARFTAFQKDGYPVVNSNRPIVGYLGLATQITSMLQFLEQNGDSITLAEPRLSCKSGGTSEFVAGGEIPIPVASGFGQVDVTYKQYGVVIKFEPKADLKDNIASKISVEVSQPDPGNSVNGFVAFSTNRTTTEVSMKPNEPLVISGLLRMQNAKALEAVPGISKLPILGALFKSRENRNERTELLVVVTPRVQRPDSSFNVQGVAKAQEHTDRVQKLVSDRLVD